MLVQRLHMDVAAVLGLGPVDVLRDKCLRIQFHTLKHKLLKLLVAPADGADPDEQPRPPSGPQDRRRGV